MATTKSKVTAKPANKGKTALTAKPKRKENKSAMASKGTGPRPTVLGKAEANEALQGLAKRHAVLKTKHREMKRLLKLKDEEIVARDAEIAEWEEADEEWEDPNKRLRDKNKALEARVNALQVKVRDMEAGFRPPQPAAASAADDDSDERRVEKLKKAVERLKAEIIVKDAEIAAMKKGSGDEAQGPGV